MTETVLFIGLLLGQLTVTSYQSIAKQTDDSPYHTAIGERVSKGNIAVSRDLLCPVNKYCRRNIKMFCDPNKVHYGDYVYVEGFGFLRVNDCMGESKWDKVNKRRVPIRRAIDIWVGSAEEERAIGLQKRKVFLLTRRIYEESIQKN